MQGRTGVTLSDPKGAQINTNRSSRASNNTPPAPSRSVTPILNVGIVNAFGRSFDMSKPEDAAAYKKAQEAELARQRSRSPVPDIRGDVDVTRRTDTRTNENGVVQTGTVTSPKPMTMDEANKLLTGGYQVQNPFASNQLPVSATDIYGEGGANYNRTENIPENMYSVRPKTLGKNLDIDAGPFMTGDEAPTYDAGIELQSEMLRGSPNIVQGGAAETAAATNSATDSAKPSIPKRPRGERAGEMWDRKYGRMANQSETTEPQSSGFDMARRRAFLDADSSLQGLRRVEGQKGIVVAGGTYNMVNPNRGQEGQNDFVQISKGDRDAYMGGRKTAQDLKAQYVDKITAANAGQDASAVIPSDT